MSTNDAQKRAVSKYDNKRGAKGLYLKLYADTDNDIIDRLDSVESKQAYIKSLIRKDMEKNQ